MATLNARYRINGLLDTSQTAMDNMTAVVNSCNAWLSYDALVGKWAVVINQADSAEYSFDDNNIIGAITLTTTDLNNYYNSAEVRFHNFALRDREDYVLLEIPAAQRLPNEPDNRLIINAPMVNNQIQAQLLGLIELKQSRLDKVINFVTDYSYVNIEAGTIISVTNSVYGWTNKLFRILQMSEQQGGDTIQISITAQEYSASIYDDSDLYEYLRLTEDGLIELDPLVDVSPVTPSTAVMDENGDSLLGVLGANALMAAIKQLLEDNATGPDGIYGKVLETYEGETGKDLTESTVAIEFTTTIDHTTTVAALNAMSATTSPYHRYDPVNKNNPANWIQTSVFVPSGWDNFSVNFKTPNITMDYDLWDSGASQVRTSTIRAQPAFNLYINRGDTLANSETITYTTIDWNSNFNTLNVANPVEGTYWVSLQILQTYDLDMFWPVAQGGQLGLENEIFFYNWYDLGVGVSDTVINMKVTAS